MIFIFVKVKSLKSEMYQDHDPESRVNTRSFISTDRQELRSAIRPSLSSGILEDDVSSPDTSFANDSVNSEQELDAASSNELANTSNPTAQPTLPAWPTKQEMNCDDSPWSMSGDRLLCVLLSPNTFSKADPFQHLIRETSKPPSWEINDLDNKLRARFRFNEIPKSYMPYARALRSIIRGQIYLQQSKNSIEWIQNIRDRSGIPAEISSPQTLSTFGLFSVDIFSDPNHPARLFNKLMKIPKNDIPNLMTELQNYMKIWNSRRIFPREWWRYKGYVEGLISFLQDDSILNDLKRDMVEIQRISATSRQNSSNVRMNTGTNSPPTAMADRVLFM